MAQQAGDVTIQISDIEVNKQIQRKFCRVESDYGIGTGYISDDEGGLIITSFHLVGAIKPIDIRDNADLKKGLFISILFAAGYIDNELRLTEKSRQTSSVDDLSQELHRLKEFKRITKKITITPRTIKSFLQNEEILRWVRKEFLAAKESTENYRFKFNDQNEDAISIASALVAAGYLDGSFIVQRGRIDGLLKDLSSMIPLSDEYMLLHRDMNEEEKKEAQAIIANQDIVRQIFTFFQAKAHEKEVVLLTNEVRIYIDDEILHGTINLPFFNIPENQKNFLKQLAYFDAVSVKIERFANGELLDRSKKAIMSGPDIPFLPEEEELIVGEKIYFGGYPLTQQQYTFGTGIIAAISYAEARESIIVEAPISPGNSGGSLFVQRRGQVFRIGVINSEVARVSDKMIKIRTDLNKMKDGGVRFGSFEFVGAFREISTTLLDNLSTGRGKAYRFDPEMLRELAVSLQEDIVLNQFLDFLVPRHPPNTVRAAAAEAIKAKEAARIHEVFEYKGKKYYISADSHNKHTSASKIFEKKLNDDPRYLRENWRVKQAATFNIQFAGSYREIVKKVIVTIATNDEVSSYVDMSEFVGWDTGFDGHAEATSIIELYYEGFGSHIRPKARSQLRGVEVISLVPEDSKPAAFPKAGVK